MEVQVMKAHVMKRAWEIVRELVGDLKAKLSMALRQAWAEVKEAAAPVKATIGYSAETDSYIVELKGRTFDVRNILEENGFSLGDNPIFYRYAESEEECRRFVKQLGLDIPVKVSTEIAKKMEDAKKLAKAKSERDAKIEELKAYKPKRPECIGDGRWNGTVYGSERRGYSIYIDNVKKIISAEERAEIMKYSWAVDDYYDEIEKIKKEYQKIRSSLVRGYEYIFNYND